MSINARGNGGMEGGHIASQAPHLNSCRTSTQRQGVHYRPFLTLTDFRAMSPSDPSSLLRPSLGSRIHLFRTLRGWRVKSSLINKRGHSKDKMDVVLTVVPGACLREPWQQTGAVRVGYVIGPIPPLEDFKFLKNQGILSGKPHMLLGIQRVLA